MRIGEKFMIVARRKLRFLKHLPVINTVSQLGHESRLLVFRFGSLGNVHRLVLRGLRTAVMPKRKLKVQVVIVFG